MKVTMTTIEAINSVKPVIIGALGAVVLDGTSMIPLGAAAGVILVVYRMTRRWTQVEDQVENMGEKLERIEILLQTRPCFKNGNGCELEQKGKETK